MGGQLICCEGSEILLLAEDVIKSVGKLSKELLAPWFHVVASLITQYPHPKSLNAFRPISCLTTFRKFLGYFWVQKPPITWKKTLQDAFIPHTGKVWKLSL